MYKVYIIIKLNQEFQDTMAKLKEVTKMIMKYLQRFKVLLS